MCLDKHPSISITRDLSMFQTPNRVHLFISALPLFSVKLAPVMPSVGLGADFMKFSVIDVGRAKT